MKMNKRTTLNKLYKGKYAIGIYQKIEIDGEDTLVRLFDSVEELAKYLKKSTQLTYTILGQRLSKRTKTSDITIDNHVYEMRCINMAY